MLNKRFELKSNCRNGKLKQYGDDRESTCVKQGYSGIMLLTPQKSPYHVADLFVVSLPEVCAWRVIFSTKLKPASVFESLILFIYLLLLCKMLYPRENYTCIPLIRSVMIINYQIMVCFEAILEYSSRLQCIRTTIISKYILQKYFDTLVIFISTKY